MPQEIMEKQQGQDSGSVCPKCGNPSKDGKICKICYLKKTKQKPKKKTEVKK